MHIGGLEVGQQAAPCACREYTAGRWLLAVGVLAAQLVVLLGLAAWLLRRQDPVRR
jgi:hypothetical protein